MSVFSFVKAGKKTYDTIKSVKPALGKSKIKKAVDDVKLASLKIKGRMKRSFQKMEEDIDPARKKLRRTTQKLKGEKVTESGVSKGKDLRENKMGGGMMGRRMGYSQGSSKGKVPTTPKEKSLAKLAPPKDRITFGDVVAGRTKGKRMQAKSGLTGDTELNKKLKNLSNSLMKVDRRGKPEDFMKKRKEDRSRKIGINTYRRKP